MIRNMLSHLSPWFSKVEGFGCRVWFVASSSFVLGDVAMAGSTLLETPVPHSLLVASHLELVQFDPTAPRSPGVEGGGLSPRASNCNVDEWICFFGDRNLGS